MPRILTREEVETSRQVVHLMMQQVALAVRDAIDARQIESLEDVPVWLLDMNDSLDEIPASEWIAIVEEKIKEAMEDD